MVKRTNRFKSELPSVNLAVACYNCAMYTRGINRDGRVTTSTTSVRLVAQCHVPVKVVRRDKGGDDGHYQTKLHSKAFTLCARCLPYLVKSRRRRWLTGYQTSRWVWREAIVSS